MVVKSNQQPEAELLLEKVLGQEVKIPNLFALCPFEVKVAPRSEKLEKEVELWRSRWITDPTDLKRNRVVDPCLFARAAAPDVELDDMITVAKWVAWIYYWDDAYDYGDFDGRTRDNVIHRKQTIELFYQSLYNKSPSSIDPATIAPGYLTAQSVHEWGAVVGENCVSDSLKDWTFKVFAESCTAIARIQHIFDSGKILDLETFWAIRHDSSASLPTLALVLYADKVAFPDWFFDHKLVRKAAELSCNIIWLANDIMSARNELQCKHIDNLIPLLVYHKGITPQEAVDESARMFHQMYLDFQDLLPQLLQLGEDRGAVDEMQSYIKDCKTTCSGILHWHYHIKRYLPWQPGMDLDSVYVRLGDEDVRK